MTHLANILIASADSQFSLDMLVRIRRYGYDGKCVSSQDAALASAQQEHPDIILVGPGLEGGDAISLSLRLKQQPHCDDIPVCLMTGETSVDFKRLAIEAGLDDVISAPFTDAKLIARLRPLVRLATMHAELQYRADAAKRFGLETPPSVPPVATPADYALLTVGRELEEVRQALSQGNLSHAAEPYSAEDMLSEKNFDAAILVPEGNIEPYLDLCAQLRNNPRLFNLPVVVVSSEDVLSEDQAYGNGASAYFTDPADEAELSTAVLGLVRRQRLRWAVRQAIARTLAPASQDAGTGVYSRAFLDAYLEDRVNFAIRHGRHLSLMFFRIPDVEGVRQRFGEEQADHLRLQLAQWITGLLRGEDLTARFEENEFCVVLPDTPKGEAEIVMHRIAGVLAYTDFAVKDVYQPVKVWVRVGSADLQPGESAATLVTRAREGIA